MNENTSPSLTTHPTVIVAGRLWDGLAQSALGPMEILVNDGRIVAMDKNVPRPDGAAVVDLTGHTVTPGFIDAHVHVTMRPNIVHRAWSLSPSMKALHGVQALAILLQDGFTTVRDVGDLDLHGFTTVDLANAVERGIIAGPRLVPSGHMVSSRGGHGDGTAMLAPDSASWQFGLADGPEEIRKVVREEVRGGAKWIKFGGTGGFGTPSDDPSQVPYSLEEMKVLVQTARDLDVDASPHAYGDEGIRRAVLAGARAIEHGNLASAETLRLMEEKGVYVVPTQITVVRNGRNAMNDAYWKAAGRAPYVRAKYQKYAQRIVEAAHNLSKSAVKVVFGSDIGMFNYDQNPAQEFGELVANGLTPLRALQAATSTAAEMLRLPDVGVLAVGNVADIVAMPGDPFEDIRVTEKVDFVMKGGVVHKRR